MDCTGYVLHECSCQSGNEGKIQSRLPLQALGMLSPLKTIFVFSQQKVESLFWYLGFWRWFFQASKSSSVLYLQVSSVIFFWTPLNLVIFPHKTSHQFISCICKLFPCIQSAIAFKMMTCSIEVLFPRLCWPSVLSTTSLFCFFQLFHPPWQSRREEILS